MAFPTSPEHSTTVSVKFHWRDYQGQPASTNINIDHEFALSADASGDATLAVAIGAIGAALESQSNAILRSAAAGSRYGFQTGKGANPTGAAFPTKRAKMMLCFENSVSGKQLEIALPAPKDSATFKSDALPDEYIAAPSAIADITAAFNAHGVNVLDGAPAAIGAWAFTRGYVIDAKKSKSINPGWGSERGGD